MSLFSTPGALPPASPSPPANAQAGGRAIAAQYVPASGKVPARLPTVDPVGLQDDLVSISRQGLQTGGAGLARSTSESAQSFMNTFARRLFGDEASTASVSYNLKAGFAAGSGAAAADPASSRVPDSEFELTRAASFTGIGQINTDDGRVFDFELKVKYEPKAELSEVKLQRSARPVIEMPDVLVLTGVPLPEIKFPGSLDDLYKLLSRELRTEVSNGPSGDTTIRSGDLTLRLQRLVERAALLAPRARPDDPAASGPDLARALAQTYGATVASKGSAQA